MKEKLNTVGNKKENEAGIKEPRKKTKSGMDRDGKLETGERKEKDFNTFVSYSSLLRLHAAHYSRRSTEDSCQSLRDASKTRTFNWGSSPNASLGVSST